MSEEDAVIKACEKILPSAVMVSTVQLVEDYFYRAHPVEGVGSGLIADSKGYILTSRHVVTGARRIQVMTPDGKVLDAKVVGEDPAIDSAVLKIEGKGLPAAELGDSDTLRIGQTVIAIGVPFRLTGGATVTKGVISAVSRTIQSDRGNLENLVQTDAAINPGNSGGPLIDIGAKVIAINTAIIPFAQGIGFAIPINAAKRILNRVLKYGSYKRPWLGVVGVDITTSLANYYKLSVSKGVLVARVLRGSPAYEAGIAAGDSIVEVEGSELKSMSDLVAHLEDRNVGDEISLTVVRGRQKGKFTARLEETPSEV
ncbi:MAG: trypsin-like peptidase domain-containing protein [Promethearchaeati archaeon SRVP18_Atabeyarchaeia-1]